MANERGAVRGTKKVAVRKARTAEEKEHAQDQRLQDKYGITLADRNTRIREQGNKCKCCGRPFDDKYKPFVDHFHFHIEVTRYFDTFLNAESGWEARGFDERLMLVCSQRAATKKAARSAVKKIMLPWSVRGCLCVKCNRGIGAIERLFDAAMHPENLYPVIAYFRARLEKALTNRPNCGTM